MGEGQLQGAERHASAWWLTPGMGRSSSWCRMTSLAPIESTSWSSGSSRLGWPLHPHSRSFRDSPTERLQRGLDELDLRVSEVRNVISDRFGIALEAPLESSDLGTRGIRCWRRRAAPPDESSPRDPAGHTRQSVLDGSRGSSCRAKRRSADCRSGLVCPQGTHGVGPSDRGSNREEHTSSLRPCSEPNYTGACTAKVPSGGITPFPFPFPAPGRPAWSAPWFIYC